jgi:hypothetical protein
MKKNNIILGSLILAGLMTGCGSGTSNNNTPTNTASTGPVGPVSYQSIYDKFNPDSKSNQKNALSHSLQGFSNGCGNVMNDSGTGLTTASGFINLIPDAGPILGAIVGGGGLVLSLFGAGAGSNCVAQEFQSIENQLLIQQQQINQIESSLSLSSNFIWNNIATVAGNIGSADYNTFTTNLDKINGSDGALEYVYYQAGFYDPDEGALTNQTLVQLLNNSTNLAATSAAYSNTIQQIAGAKYTACDTESGYKICYKNVVADTDSALMNLLSSANSYLNAELTNQFNTGNNLVPLLDDYNNTIMSYYQQSLSAIQSAYHLAYLANYINYQTGAGSGSGMSMNQGLQWVDQLMQRHYRIIMKHNKTSP